MTTTATTSDPRPSPRAEPPVVPLTAIDHVVFRVDDVEAAAAWWRDRFGLATERLDEWRAGEAPFPWIRVSETMILDLWPGGPDGTNVDHVAFVTDPASFDTFVAANRDDLERPPGFMGGARGRGEGAYILDPSGNRIELRTYRP